LARQDRDAVVGLLAAEHAAVAEAGQHVIGELRVLELGFLQRDDVRLRGLQPLLQMRQADVEGVDVPAGDFHGTGVGFVFPLWIVSDNEGSWAENGSAPGFPREGASNRGQSPFLLDVSSWSN